MATELTVDVTKTFSGGLTINLQFSAALDPPSVMILFGPSGCGKTTALRCLAGLEWPERGHIRCGAETWLDVEANVWLSPQDRQVGYMFQDYALFPTETVEGNIEFGLGHLTRPERKARIREALTLLQLQSVSGLKPRQLSGGQQQRVALARAVARRPRLLLLDEPLSALDVPTRGRLQGELRHLLSRLEIPCIVVTHDWGEALAFGDRMAVVSQGRVLQLGSPQDVFNRPQNAEVARIVGMESALEGRIVEASAGLLSVDVSGTLLHALGRGEPVGPDVFVCIRAEDVVLEKGEGGASSARNRLRGTVRTVSTIGALARVKIDCGFPLSAVVTRPAVEDLHLVPGEEVTAFVKAGAVHLVPRYEAVASGAA